MNKICIKCEVLVSNEVESDSCLAYCGCQTTDDEMFDLERWVEVVGEYDARGGCLV